MYLLDTDIVSLIFRGAQAYPMLYDRLREAGNGRVWVSVITIEEMARGALAEIRLEQQRGKGTQGYQRLQKLLQLLAEFPVLPCLPCVGSTQGRHGDCQIAAIALLNEAIVVTRNLRHFGAIPEVVSEDWTTA